MRRGHYRRRSTPRAQEFNPRPPVARAGPRGIDDYARLLLRDYRAKTLPIDYFYFVDTPGVSVERIRFHKAYKDGHANIKVSDQTLGILKAEKKRLRRILGGKHVIDMALKTHPDYGFLHIYGYFFKHSVCYYHSDFVENTYVIEKHLDELRWSRLGWDGRRPTRTGAGPAHRTTSIRRGLKEELDALKEERGYESLDQLIHTLLTNYRRDYEYTIKNMENEINYHMLVHYGLGSQGDKYYLTNDTWKFIEEHY